MVLRPPSSTPNTSPFPYTTLFRSFCPHTVFMCFVWIWEQTAIIPLYNINWLVFITKTEYVYCVVQTGYLYTASLTFSNSTFCPHSVFMCFVWIWEQTAIISLYNINWLVFITETEYVYCVVRTGYLYTASLTFSNSTFCPYSVFVCFVWIREQTAIISLYNINRLVSITQILCVYCAVRLLLLLLLPASDPGLFSSSPADVPVLY
jgi:hypothetical protein